jgi:uncharacterized Zn-finger protein
MALKEVEVTAKRQAQEKSKKKAQLAKLKLDVTAYEAHRKKQSEYAKQHRTPEIRLQYARKADAKTIASEKFKCKTCGTVFSGQFDLDLHYLTPKHINRLSGNYKVDKNRAAKKHHCGICGRSFADSSHLNDHYKTNKHKTNAAKAAAVLSSSS